MLITFLQFITLFSITYEEMNSSGGESSTLYLQTHLAGCSHFDKFEFEDTDSPLVPNLPQIWFEVRVYQPRSTTAKIRDI